MDGEEAAFERFYRDHLRLVYAAALAGTAGDSGAAEDATQETLLRAWREFACVQTLAPASQRAWLLRTLRHLLVDAWRQRGGRRRNGIEVAADEGVMDNTPAPTNGEPLLRLEVARALAILPEPDREMIVLRYFADLNSREISETLGIPEGTVRRRLAECRERLAESLEGWAVKA